MDIDVQNIIANKLSLKKKNYCAIIGQQPSKGARSPLLWNRVFKKFNIDAYFYPFDVKDKKNLKNLIFALKKDKNYLGGAVTVPYKESVITHLDSLTLEAKMIGAVNSIKRGKKNELVGDNTDGKAAILELKSKIKNIHKKSILVLGLGGAGLAVATCLANEVNDLTVWNRSLKKSKLFVSQMKKYKKKVKLVKTIETIKNFDIIVNCTSVGFKNNKQQKNNIPLKKNLLSGAKSNLFIYDIIYQPKKTPLIKIALKKNLRAINGLGMNLIQAVIACNSVIPSLTMKDIKNAMKN